MSTALAQALPADATRVLYEQHSSRIFGFCLSRLGSREEAEDAVQTTFLNAQRGLGRGVVPEYELAWLFKIAQNVCHNRHQSARRRGRVEATQDLDALQDVIASPDLSPAVPLGELTHALEAIPTRQRRALLLREFKGYSYEEIASELDISVAAVETLLFRARRAVAQQLEQSGATSSTRRGAAASVLELFRWLYGGAAAPLKLAAVAAAVATTATLSVVTGHKPVPGVPVIVKHPAVVPASNARRRSVPRTTVLPATERPAAKQSPGPTLAVPAAPAVHAATSGPGGAQPAVSSATVEPATAPAVPIVSVPAEEVTLPTVPLPTVTVPDIAVPAVTLPAVVLPNAQLPTTPDLPKLP